MCSCANWICSLWIMHDEFLCFLTNDRMFGKMSATTMMPATGPRWAPPRSAFRAKIDLPNADVMNADPVIMTPARMAGSSNMPQDTHDMMTSWHHTTSETGGPVFIIQKPNGSILATDVQWLGCCALRPQQGDIKGLKGPEMSQRFKIQDVFYCLKYKHHKQHGINSIMYIRQREVETVWGLFTTRGEKILFLYMCRPMAAKRVSNE